MKRLAVILCGGQGRRMKPITRFIHKALIPQKGIAMLQRIVVQLNQNGYSDFLLLTGHLSYQIEEFTRTNLSNYNIKIISTVPEYSPAERLLNAANFISNYESFTLCYCDNLLNEENTGDVFQNLDNNRLVISNSQKGNLSFDFVTKNIHYHMQRSDNLNFTEIGYITLDSLILFNDLIKTRDLQLTLSNLSRSHELKGIPVNTYISTSNLERYLLSRKRDRLTVLLDRDGIILKSMERGKYVVDKEQIKFIGKNLQFLAELSSKYLVDYIFITNQAGVELGLLSEDSLLELHQYLALQLNIRGIPTLAFYHCPHHWETNCDCRKPKPGLITQAINEFSLDPNSIIMIGDTESDVKAGTSAKIKSFLLPESLNSQVRKAKYAEIEKELLWKRVPQNDGSNK